MMIGNLELIDFIRAKIASTGPVSFRWFMEQALYHPEYGYYASGRAVIGKQGDFFTSVSVGSLFGKLLALQFLEMWEQMGRPDPFTLVEQGAHNGDFAADLLSAIQGTDCFNALRYRIVEPLSHLEAHQKLKLKAFPQVVWHRSLEELEPFTGVHFSNELIDAMPVDRVRFTQGSWYEQYVEVNSETSGNNPEIPDLPPSLPGFKWIDRPISSDVLAQKTTTLPPLENYRTEVNLAIHDWIDLVATKLVRGYLLTLDYGYPHDLYYSPERANGTLACYTNHQRHDNPFEAVGYADLTAHVDFTSLAERAELNGFEIAGFTDQHHFMVGLGSRFFTDSDRSQTPEQQKSLRAFQTLMHPNFMGLAFKALALRKGLNATPLLGFAFAADPRTALGLE